ncbi:MAG: hypothetical protein PWQ82_792 [Thermosediminibacterales bacterium]|nr:hypothetical protein [Thermosediminibacterales bacterium]MDK2835635.1 hypothetical protein [Thermosediminibacterales bacterium]
MDLGDVIALLVIIGIPLLRKSRANKAKTRKDYRNRRLPRRPDVVLEIPRKTFNNTSKTIKQDTLKTEDTLKTDQPLKNDKAEPPKAVKKKKEKQKSLSNPVKGFFDTESFIKGIIMSEILGPPKSRK